MRNGDGHYHGMGRARGFTLAEMLVSLAILGLLLTAMGSLVVLGARALPGKQSRAEMDAALDRGLARAADEVAQAESLLALGEREVRMKLPDQTGDGEPEVVSYTWSGTAGDPLVRTYNGVAEVVAEGVRRLAVTYTEANISTTTSTAASAGSETRLAKFDDLDAPGMAPMRSNWWPAVTLTPVLPPAATGFRVTKVRLYARQDGLATGVLTAQLWRTNASGLPSTKLDEAFYLELLLPLSGSPGWVTITLNSGTVLTPGTKIALVFPNTSSSSSGQLGLRTGGVADTGSEYLVSTNSGSSWTTYSDSSLLYELYGVVTATGTSKATERAVQSIALAATNGSGKRVVTARMLQRPAVPSGVTATAELIGDGVLGQTAGLVGGALGVDLEALGSLGLTADATAEGGTRE